MRLRELRFHNAGLLERDYGFSLNPRVTLVLGDNEAGKSTMRRAIEALLFGPTLALVLPGTVAGFDCAAAVEFRDSGPIPLRRRGKNWVLAPSAPLQALLAPELASRFRDLFCLSHDNLHPEGERFLGSDGTLGSLLFGASTGLRPQALEAALKSVERDLKTARGSGAGSLLERRLEEFRAQREQRAHTARFAAHEQACGALEQAEAELTDCDARASAIERAQRQLERLLRGAGTWRELSEARTLHPRADEQWPDAEQATRLAGLRAQLGLLRTQLEEQTRAAQAARRLLENCELPGPLAALAPAVERLRDEVARASVDRVELDRDLQTRADAQAELRRQLQAIGAEAGSDPLAAAQALLLPLPIRAALEAALESWQASQAERSRLMHTRGEAEEAVRIAARAADDVLVAELTTLESALPAAERAMRLEGDLAQREALLQRKLDECVARRAALGLRMAASADAGMEAPDRARTALLEGALMDARSAQARSTQQLKAADAEHARRQADSARLCALLAEAPTDARLTQAREVRDSLWLRLRSCWTPALRTEGHAALEQAAQAFELAVQQLDLLHAARIAAGESLGQAQAAQAAVDAARRTLEDQQREHAASSADLAGAEALWAAHWQILDAPPGNPGEWHARHEAWRGLEAERVELEREIAALRRARESAGADALAHLQGERGRFEAYASAAGLHEALSAEALRRRAANAQARERQQALRSAQGGLARVAHQLAQLAASESEWTLAWRALCSQLPAGPGEQPAGVRAWLDAQAELRRLCADIGVLDSRIGQRRERAEELARRLGELLSEARSAFPELPIPATLGLLDGYPLLRDSAQAAQARLREQQGHQQALAGTEAQVSELALKLAVATRELDALWSQLGYPEAAQDEAIGRRLQLAAQASQAQQAQDKLEVALNAYWGETRAVFESELAENGEASLRSRLELLKLEAEAAAEAQDRARQGLHAARQALAELGAEHDAVGVEYRYTAARDRVIDAAEQLHRLALADYLLERAKAHASEGLIHLEQCASACFATLSSNSYSGLRIDPVAHTLYALGAQGDKTLEQLSSGTRDQIWLALRVAAITQAARETPFPLLLDDVFVQFDDERSGATLRMLLELSAQVQVIAFTHHEHVADLAQALIPPEQLAIVTLPRPDAQARVRILDRQRARRERPAPVARTEAAGLASTDPASPTPSLAALESWIQAQLQAAGAALAWTDFARAAQSEGLELEKRAWQLVMSGLIEAGQIVRSGEGRGTRYAATASRVDAPAGPE